MTRCAIWKAPVPLGVACVLIFGAVGGVGVPASTQARASVYYTDYYSGPRIRPVIVDGSPNVRAGPFHRWRGWGTSKAKATVRRGALRTTVVMRDIRRCRGRRQYRVLYIYGYEDGRQLGPRKRYINRACLRR